MSGEAIRHRLTNNPWEVVIEPLTEWWPYRYRVYLSQVGTAMISGIGGWGWVCFTLRGARRKGARELARHNRQAARKRARQALIDGNHNI